MLIFIADKLVGSTSYSLMHTTVDLNNETKLDDELKSWLAFAAQKINETIALAKSVSGQNDEAVQCHLLHSSMPFVTVLPVSLIFFVL